MRKWIAHTAILGCSLNLFAQPNSEQPAKPFKQGQEVSRTPLAGYNHAARIDVSGCCDFFLGGSFIYWQSLQEGMDQATTRDFNTQISNFPRFPTDGQITYQGFEFKPGFKVTTGWNSSFDDWSAYAEYTWFRSSTHSSFTAPTGQTFVAQNWLTPLLNNFGPSLSSRWNLRIDLLDANLSRPYYQGTRLTISPYGGLRAAWIRQTFRLAYSLTGSPGDAVPSNPVLSHNRSYSWGLGPRAGVATHWLLSRGFQVDGEVSTSLLFTQYTKVSNVQDRADASASGTALQLRMTDYNCVRPNATALLGLAWGSYFNHQQCHFDFTASYEFSVFWWQNMMRRLVDAADRTAATPGSLYLQGLTAAAHIDF